MEIEAGRARPSTAPIPAPDPAGRRRRSSRAGRPTPTEMLTLAGLDPDGPTGRPAGWTWKRLGGGGSLQCGKWVAVRPRRRLRDIVAAGMLQMARRGNTFSSSVRGANKTSNGHEEKGASENATGRRTQAASREGSWRHPETSGGQAAPHRSQERRRVTANGIIRVCSRFESAMSAGRAVQSPTKASSLGRARELFSCSRADDAAIHGEQLRLENSHNYQACRPPRRTPYSSAC